MRRPTFFVSVSLVTLLALPAAAANAPLRHLAFAYDMSTTSTLERQGSGLADSGGIASGSAIQRSTARQDNKGTIDADVVAATGDGGLIVTTSEEGNERLADTQVAIRSDGSLLTAPNAKLTDEQRYILTLLGRKIMPYSTALVGDSWQISEAAGKGISDVITFRITGVNDPVVHLAVSRVIDNRTMGAYQLSLTGTIDYDYKHLVPVAGNLQGITHYQNVDGLNTVQTLLTFSLAQDSFVGAGTKPNS